MKAKSINYTLLLTLLFALNACGSSDENSENDTTSRERVVAVETLDVDKITFTDHIRINGNVSALEDAIVSAETGGQVLFVAESGTIVRKGDVILRIDDRQLRAGYDAAKTGYELALDVYNRQAALYADSVISTLQYLQSKAQRDQAAAQLASIDKQLSDARLKAPFSGRIEGKLTSVGQFVAPGMPVVRLVNTSKIKVTGGVPERYSGVITTNSTVNVKFRNYTIGDRASKISFAGNLINPDSRTFPIEITLDNPGNTIKPKMIADLQIVRAQRENSIVIPRTALVRDELGHSVYVVNSNGESQRAALRYVEISLISGDFVIIGSGVSAGDQIIIAGLTSLNDGDLINITARRDIKELIPNID